MSKFCAMLFCLLMLCGCQKALPFPELAENSVRPNMRFADHRPIAFVDAVIDMKRGTPYLVYPFWRWETPNVSAGLYYCNSYLKHRFANSQSCWKQGREEFGNWKSEAADYVNQPLAELGYDVVSANKSLFGVNKEELRAELQLAARIVDVRVNLCEIKAWWGVHITDKSGGSAYIKVNWEIYDALRKKVVATLTTEGIAYQDEPVETGRKLLLLNALSDAAERLGKQNKFYQIMTSKGYEPIQNPKKLNALILNADMKPYRSALEDHYEFVRRGVVTVRNSAGHGSGFFINDEGYALTNAHVVGSAQSVALIDFSGTQFMADVIRTDEEQDVALIKADVTQNHFLPISRDFVKPLDKVYGIGSPGAESFKNTITHGVISAIRQNKKTDKRHYQVDMTMAKGESGGPLLDENGNVIGIMSRILVPSDAQSGFGYVIPIGDALKALNIRVQKPKFP